MTAEALRDALVHLEWAILCYFLVVNGFYLVLLVSAALEMRSHVRAIRGESRWRVLGSAAAPRISVIAPAYNEEATIGESVPALLALFYPNLEVVVVNDGSKDATIDVLLDLYDLTRSTRSTTAPSPASRSAHSTGRARTPTWWWSTRRTGARRTR
jgi:cellulose synthase/poly-beta-1,6-N-acetylglucosamine synthase-like glycosyltransferase